MKELTTRTAIWITCGIVLSVLTVLCVYLGVHYEPVVLVGQEIVAEAVSNVFDGIRAGDAEALREMLYGRPKLQTLPEGTLWEAYRESICCSFPDPVYSEGTRLCIRTSVECLDISSVLADVEQTAPELLNKNAERMLAGEEHEQGKAAARAVQEAMEQALAAPDRVSGEIELELIRSKDGQWQVIPTDALVALIYGSFWKTR